MIQRHTLPNGQPIDLPGIVPKLSETPGRTQWVGINQEMLFALALKMPEIVGHEVPGQVMKAGSSTRRHSVPDRLLSRD